PRARAPRFAGLRPRGTSRRCSGPAPDLPGAGRPPRSPPALRGRESARRNPIAIIRRMLVEPTLEQILAFCDVDPIERVFLEDVARRGFARFQAIEDDGRLAALCYFGANVVPSGQGCGAFADEAAVRTT